VAPVVGVAGTSAVPMAIVMAALSAGGLLTFTRRRAPAPSVSAGA
jgi:hypothetical protein